MRKNKGHPKDGCDVLELHSYYQKKIYLHELSAGDEIFVVTGDEPQDFYRFVIISVPQGTKVRTDDVTRANIVPWESSDDATPKRVVELGGACTYNPNSPLNMSCYIACQLTVGRSFVFWVEGQEYGEVVKKPIKKIFVKKK